MAKRHLALARLPLRPFPELDRHDKALAVADDGEAGDLAREERRADDANEKGRGGHRGFRRRRQQCRLPDATSGR